MKNDNDANNRATIKIHEDIIKIIKEYLQELSEKGVYISRCFLYGSHARGTATEESDIDLMLVSPLFDEDKEKYAPVLWLSTRRTDYKIEPFAVGEKRFLTEDGSPLIETVRQEGIEINI